MLKNHAICSESDYEESDDEDYNRYYLIIL